MKEILYIYKHTGYIKLRYTDEDGHSRDSSITDFLYIDSIKPGIVLDTKNIIIKETWYKYGSPYILSTFSSILRKNKLWM